MFDVCASGTAISQRPSRQLYAEEIFMPDMPLELYEQAYRLHYESENIAGACSLYKEIIKKFPESNECGYAVIQLQKIGAREIARTLDAKHSKEARTVIALLVVNFAVLVGVIVAASIMLSHAKMESKKSALMLQAVAKMTAGQNEEALGILDALKAGDRKNLLPYQLSAQIYLKNKDYDKALAEYQAYKAIQASSTQAAEEMARIQKEQQAGRAQTAESADSE
jgi:hypothetical protein